MNKEEIRKQFERLVIELNSGVLLERNANDSYKSSLTQYMWWSYQAALAIKQEPVAYRLIASANGEVVRDSLEFTRMSEIDEKVVRKSYDLQIIPLYDNQQDHIESNQEAHSDLKVAISALKELACLGNGDIYGNSI